MDALQKRSASKARLLTVGGFLVVLGGVVATLWLSFEVKTHVTPSPTFAPTEGFLFGR